MPFDLVGTPSADNLYLKSAQWPDWQEDPSSYYAAYDRGSEAPDDPRRPLLKVPVADYAAAYLLAAADDDLGLSSEVSLRIGVLDGPRRTTLHDFSAEVPRWRGKRNAVTQAVFPVSRGNLYLVRVPIGTAFAQDFTDEWGLDLEVTKQLRLAIRRPDPCRYQVRPLGLPSGVHLFGMTLMRSPIQLRVSSNEAGHVFNEPRTPTFHVRLHGVARKTTCTVEAVATDYYGQQTVVRTGELTVEPGEKLEQELEIGVACAADIMNYRSASCPVAAKSCARDDVCLAAGQHAASSGRVAVWRLGLQRDSLHTERPRHCGTAVRQSRSALRHVRLLGRDA